MKISMPKIGVEERLALVRTESAQHCAHHCAHHIFCMCTGHKVCTSYILVRTLVRTLVHTLVHTMARTDLARTMPADLVRTMARTSR